MFHSEIGFLRLSHPRLVSVLFPAPSLLEMKFFQKLFPLVSLRFSILTYLHTKVVQSFVNIQDEYFHEFKDKTKVILSDSISTHLTPINSSSDSFPALPVSIVWARQLCRRGTYGQATPELLNV